VAARAIAAAARAAKPTLSTRPALART
jgi:hypothetical protein